MKIRHLIRFAAGLCAITLLGTPAFAQEDARAIFKKASEFYANSEKLSVAVTMDYKMNMQGMDMDMGGKYNLKLQRPNKYVLFSNPQGMMTMMLKHEQVYSNGESTIIYRPDSNQYTVGPKATDLGETGVADPMGMQGGEISPDGVTFGLLSPTSSILTIAADAAAAKHLGTTEVDGKQVHHLRADLMMGGMKMDMEFWIEAGDKPFVQKIVPDLSGMFAVMAEQAPPDQREQARAQLSQMKMEVSYKFSNWSTEVNTGPEAFEFSPPETATKVDKFPSALPPGFGAGGGGGGFGGLGGPGLPPQ